MYTAILARRRIPDVTGDRAAFYQRYYEAIAQEKAKADAALVNLPGPAG
jgi:hypothetical protein